MDCIFEGCEEKVIRKDIPKHLETHSWMHMQLMINQINELKANTLTMKSFIDELKTENEFLKNQIQQLNRQIQDYNSVAITCKIENKQFSGDDHLSYNFILHGLKFEIWLFPNEKETGTVGIYLFVDEDIRPVLKWKFTLVVDEPVVVSTKKDFQELARIESWGCAVLEKEKNPWLNGNISEFTIVTTIESISFSKD